MGAGILIQHRLRTGFEEHTVVRYFISFLIVCIAAGSAQAATTINSVNKYSYGANIGWVNAEANGTNGVVVGEFFSSGYLYGANVGWIHLGDGSPDNGWQYFNASATDYGVNMDQSGLLHGFGYGANIGWVNFEPTGAPRVDLITGKMSGYAYGANVGWIGLSNMQAHVQTDILDPGPDTDMDNVPDAWELAQTNTLAGLSGGGDADDDGASDGDEYVAATDPLNGSSLFTISNEVLDPAMSESDVTWESVLTRLYRVELNTSLSNSEGWTDSGLGDISPDAGTSTTRTMPLGGPNLQYYRVKAIRPLAP